MAGAHVNALAAHPDVHPAHRPPGAWPRRPLRVSSPTPDAGTTSSSGGWLSPTSLHGWAWPTLGTDPCGVRRQPSERVDGWVGDPPHIHSRWYPQHVEVHGLPPSFSPIGFLSLTPWIYVSCLFASTSILSGSIHTHKCCEVSRRFYPYLTNIHSRDEGSSQINLTFILIQKGINISLPLIRWWPD